MENKECEEFSYDSLWDEEEKKKEKKALKELPIGAPRKGIKGKWIKRKNHVTRNQVRCSYGNYIKEEREKMNL